MSADEPPTDSGPPPLRPAALPRSPGHPRRRRVLFALLVAVLAIAGASLAQAVGRVDRTVPQPYPAASVTGGGPTGAAGTAPLEDGPVGALPAASYPERGPGTFQIAAGTGPVRGSAGPVRRYQVAVEDRSGVPAADFARAVEAVLGDGRSWIASKRLRVQRVDDADGSDFTVYLATPVTSERMCAEGGLTTERFTSCRLPGQIIINLARWQRAVPDYGAPLEVYRAYVINHEVGHEFGEQHVDCPGPGQPAPVMQQQTYGLRGCTANAWPYLGGRRYDGSVIP